MSKNLILIFVRNPALGKVKTRLSKTIGNQKALKAYTLLLDHTKAVLDKRSEDKVVYYSENIQYNDLWDKTHYQKKIQKGNDLGARMGHAFAAAFKEGYDNVVIVGSDLFDLKPLHIEAAFRALETHELVLGPSLDGGYYLLGMKTLHPSIFKNKKWGTDSVLNATLQDLKQQKVKLLEALNDIDTFEDLQEHPELLKKLTHYDKIH